MSLDAAWAVAQGAMFQTMGIAATVTRPAPNDTPITTTLVWVNRTTQDEPGGARYQRRDPIRLAAFLIADVPTLPKGTTVQAAELEDGDVKTWKVDGVDRADADEIRAVLIAVPD